MTEPNYRFQLHPFPKMRRLVVDAGWLVERRHVVHGLVEFDVTEARRKIREREERTGDKLSFSAFIVSCLGLAVEEHKMVHAYRDWLGRVVIFEAVDAMVIVETEKDGVALSHVLRSINRRTAEDLSAEIRKVQKQRGESPSAPLMEIFSRLPAILRRPFWMLLRRSPLRWKKMGGTVSVTAVGMFGKGSGWGIPFGNHTLSVTLGGIEQKPRFLDGKIEPRDILCLTITFDHDLVDGAPAARFLARFKDLIETSHGIA